MKPTIYVRFVWCLLSITSILSYAHGRQNLVIQKLVKVFENSDEDLARVLYFLESACSSHWRNLDTLIKSEGAFKIYAQQLTDDTKTAGNNPRVQNTNQPDVKDIVRKKLLKVFEDSDEDLVRILLFLEENDKLYQTHESGFSSHWKNLETLIDNERDFKRHAKQLADDAKTAENNSRGQNIHQYDVKDIVRKKLVKVFRDSDEDLVRILLFLEENDKLYQNLESDSSSHWKNLEALIDSERAFKRYALELVDDAKTAENNPEASRITLNNRALITTFGNTVGFATQIGLDKVYLTWEALRNIYRWWTGEISGNRCAKNIVDETITTAAGVAGAVGGATVGMAFGPFGGLFGGIFGAAFSSKAAGFLIDLLTQHLFGLPQNEALEKAYDCLGVEHTASNAEVNEAYRRLSRRYHPDKGGDVNKYYLVQNAMAIIRLARGEH